MKLDKELTQLFRSMKLQDEFQTWNSETTVFPRIRATISKYKQRGSERIVYKLESEKSESVNSHQLAAALIRGKTVEFV
jgi:CRISPR/Cas system CSM-associated protein Csm3 (group 7 of RAMP superfamily)